MGRRFDEPTQISPSFAKPWPILVLASGEDKCFLSETSKLPIPVNPPRADASVDYFHLAKSYPVGPGNSAY